jgi:hypothetical protein
VGPLAEDALAEIHADILFLGVGGFDIEIGLTTPNLLESRVKWGNGQGGHQSSGCLRLDQIQSP